MISYVNVDVQFVYVNLRQDRAKINPKVDLIDGLQSVKMVLLT